MLIRELLAEAIVNPPRIFSHWAKLRCREFDRLIEQAKSMKADWEIVQACEENVERKIEDALSYGFDDIDEVYRAMDRAKSLFVRAEERFKLTQLRDNLDAMREYGWKFAQYFNSSVGYIDWQYIGLDVLEPLLAKAGEIEGVLAAENVLNPDYQDAEFIRAAQAWVRAIHTLADFVPRIKALIDHCVEKIKAMADRREARYQEEMHGRLHKPAHHGEVETLYHASAWAAEIVRDGFAAEPPEDRRGLGNMGGGQPTISFTHDIEIARQIVRCLRELIMIGRGEIKAHQILGWLRAERIAISPTDIYQLVGVLPEKIQTPERVAMLYEMYLSRTKIRSNPFFIGAARTMTRMQGRSERDVGIIAATVDLTQASEYLTGESEYRVPASAVRDIRRVL